jgi:acetyltransferase-like isoleucine patch superfamily enzyme
MVGEGCWIGAFTLLDGSGGLTIGRGCDISAGAQVYTHTTVRRVVSARELDIERAPTVIGDHVHIGAGAIVLMGCDIGSNSVVGAGAVVRQHTVAPEWSLLVGNPARIVHDGARRYSQPAGERS